MKSVNLWPTKFIQAVRLLFLSSLTLDTWKFIRRFAPIKEVMSRDLTLLQMSEATIRYSGTFSEIGGAVNLQRVVIVMAASFAAVYWPN